MGFNLLLILLLVGSSTEVCRPGSGTGAPAAVGPRHGGVDWRQDPQQATVSGGYIALAQTQEEIEGALDLSRAAKEQIETFEGMLRRNGDMSAEKQAVIMLWLVDLYESIGEFDGVEWSYRRVLAFFPADVGVMNAYALFLIEKRHDGERAESLLVEASHWGRYTDARSLDRGGTYQLRSRVEIEKGDFESAIRHATMAVELMDDESSADARRVLAKSYLGAGYYDTAAEVYIDLIALERGAVTEDINALKLFIDRTDSYTAEDLNVLIDRAIADREAEKRRRVEAEAAELVAIPSSDGVMLEGTLRRRGGEGAILFIPDLGSTRTVYKPYAQLLGIDGISSLTLDLRGQGGSRSDSLLTQENLPLTHAQRLPDDVVAGFRFLERELRLDPSRIVIVTEGFAAPVVEQSLPRGGLAAPVVYLSPAFVPSDKDLANSVAFHPDLPILLFYSSEDLHALRSCSYFRKAKTFNKLKVYPLRNSGRGVDILRRNPDALESFQTWMRAVASGG
jgi:tetratricopeptide (TPR) repeat protein